MSTARKLNRIHQWIDGGYWIKGLLLGDYDDLESPDLLDGGFYGLLAANLLIFMGLILTRTVMIIQG
ncbi:MAG: hypothetical protein NWE88_10510 [Candidatus Bathyarchaeota archaeon]|nr:hypothetical protein [Candidatus Bathyarchaeota archaeon]